MQSRIGTGLSRVKNSIGQGLSSQVDGNGQQAKNSGRQSHFYNNFKQSQGLSQIQKSSPQPVSQFNLGQQPVQQPPA